MNFEEFLKKDEPSDTQAEAPSDSYGEESAETDETSIQENIDVQKAVVESLAADKAIQDEKIAELESENAELTAKVAQLQIEIKSMGERIAVADEAASLKNEVLQLRAKCAEQKVALEQVGDVLSKNSETPLSNKVSLLERDTDIPDRFPGETREHVLEVLCEARNTAEKEGRLRRAQVLEGVLLANESEGTLAKKREELEKLFQENSNIVSGPVIESLEKLGIAHKNGEDYLLPSEIIKRTY